MPQLPLRRSRCWACCHGIPSRCLPLRSPGSWACPGRRPTTCSRCCRSTGSSCTCRLIDETRHNAHFAVLHGSDVLYLIEERAPGRPSLVTDVGVRLPAQLTASGLAMLAALPTAQVRALYPARASFVQRHGSGPVSLTQLRSILVRVRERGYAVEEGTVTPDFSSVAAAVLDHSGHPAAAFALTYQGRLDEDEQARLVESARASAAELSRRIGRSRPTA